MPLGGGVGTTPRSRTRRHADHSVLDADQIIQCNAVAAFLQTLGAALSESEVGYALTTTGEADSGNGNGAGIDGGTFLD